MPIFSKGMSYIRVSFGAESVFEKTVASLADQIFGDKTIYLDIKKKLKGGNIGIVPDGYLLDLTIDGEPKLYIVENEITSHDPFQHIGIQMLKFATTFETEKINIRNIIMKEIMNNPSMKKRLEEGCKNSSSRNIDSYLDKAVYSDFRALVIIDEARDELYKVLEKINANISVLELKAYKSADGDYTYEFDNLYEEDVEDIGDIEIEKKSLSVEERHKRRERRAECDTIIVPAREDGFNQEFISNNQWYAIRIGAAMKERVKYIAAYQIAPISAVTHYAEIKEIKPYKDTGKYIVYFKSAAQEIKILPIKDTKKVPQGPVYAKLNKILSSQYLDEALAD